MGNVRGNKKQKHETKGFKTNKRKIRNSKRKRKNNKSVKNKKHKTKKRNKQTETKCNSKVANRTCMEAALTSILFEANQITNFIKQKKTLENHHRVSGNKAEKKDEFKPAKDHLLWAIGGNVSDPKCGPQNVSTAKYNGYDANCEMKVEVHNHNHKHINIISVPSMSMRKIWPSIHWPCWKIVAW